MAQHKYYTKVQKNTSKNNANKAKITPPVKPKKATKGKLKAADDEMLDDDIEPEEVESDDDVVVEDSWEEADESFDLVDQKEEDFKAIKNKEIDEITNFDINKFIHRDDDDDDF